MPDAPRRNRTLRGPEAERRALARGAATQSWGDYLSQFVWSHVVTLTTAHPAAPMRLVREFKDVFIRKLARAAQGPVPWFYAVEGSASGFPHLHALLAGTAALGTESIQARWALGFTRVARYDRGRGAAYYIAKGLLERPDDYDFSSRPPRRHERAAQVLPSDAMALAFDARWGERCGPRC